MEAIEAVPVTAPLSRGFERFVWVPVLLGGAVDGGARLQARERLRKQMERGESLGLSSRPESGLGRAWLTGAGATVRWAL